MVTSCFVASKGLLRRGSQAACSGRATGTLLLAHSNSPRGQSIGCALSRNQTPCLMAKIHILTDRGNTLHASAPATGMATLCGSTIIPVEDTTLADGHAIPQPLPTQLPTPQPRSGVPVYVMLPLDTVSLLFDACRFTTIPSWSMYGFLHPAGKQ